MTNKLLSLDNRLDGSYHAAKCLVALTNTRLITYFDGHTDELKKLLKLPGSIEYKLTTSSPISYIGVCWSTDSISPPPDDNMINEITDFALDLFLTPIRAKDFHHKCFNFTIESLVEELTVLEIIDPEDMPFYKPAMELWPDTTFNTIFKKLDSCTDLDFRRYWLVHLIQELSLNVMDYEDTIPFD